MKIREMIPEAYEAFVQNHPFGCFVQSSYNAQVRKERGFETHLLGFYEGEQLVGTAYGYVQVLHRLVKMFYIPRGFVTDYNNVEQVKAILDELKAYGQSQHYDFIRLDPYVVLEDYNTDDQPTTIALGSRVHELFLQKGLQHYGFNRDYSSLQPRFQYVYPLEGLTQQDFEHQLKPKTKNLIKACKKHGVTLVEGTLEDLPRFEKILKETGQRQGFQARSEDYYEILMKEFGKGNALRLLFAEADFETYQTELQTSLTKYEADKKKAVERNYPENTIQEMCNNISALQRKLQEIQPLIQKYGTRVDVACAMFVEYGKEISYFYSGAPDDCLFLSGQYLIQEAMIKEAIEKGYSQYNFMGVSGQADDGVLAFKKKFPGHMQALIGQYDLPCQSLKYKLYKSLQKK